MPGNFRLEWPKPAWTRFRLRSSPHPKFPSNSLRTGNLTGNFSGFGPFGRFLCPIDQINQRLAPQFPEVIGTGNFFARNREFSRRNREFIRGNREFLYWSVSQAPVVAPSLHQTALRQRRTELLWQENGLVEDVSFDVAGQVSDTISREEGAVKQAALEIGRKVVNRAVDRF